MVDEPSIFEDLGFIAPEGSFLAEPCIAVNFTVDSTAEIMGTARRWVIVHGKVDSPNGLSDKHRVSVFSLRGSWFRAVTEVQPTAATSKDR